MATSRFEFNTHITSNLSFLPTSWVSGMCALLLSFYWEVGNFLLFSSLPLSFTWLPLNWIFPSSRKSSLLLLGQILTSVFPWYFPFSFPIMLSLSKVGLCLNSIQRPKTSLVWNVVVPLMGLSIYSARTQPPPRPSAPWVKSFLFLCYMPYLESGWLLCLSPQGLRRTGTSLNHRLHWDLDTHLGCKNGHFFWNHDAGLLNIEFCCI